MHNILLEQYSVVKKELLRQSPFMCLHNRNIKKNPHQIDAFLKGISSINTGGMIFADEVGLGKTIEAGLILKYLLKSKKNNILISTPASLRVQWQEELSDKFNIISEVFDNSDMRDRDRKSFINRWIHDKSKAHVVILSYRFASTFINDKSFCDIKWDIVVIDEAHNMRNVFKGTKSAKRLYDSTLRVPKLLLTATPLQNSLDDLFGLVSYIDPRIFENEKVFNKKYVEEKRYDELKLELAPVLTRTLRREVAENMKYAARKCRRFDFKLSQNEKILYTLVDRYVKNSEFGFPNANRNLCILVIRKLLASSSFALIETFSKVKRRLEKLKEGTSTKSTETSLDEFFALLDSDEQEDWVENAEDKQAVYIKEKIESEIQIVDSIIETAEKIKYNSKMTKLIEAVNIALNAQKEKGISEKIVIFTESLRTQKYIFDSLISSGFDEDEIVLFNGNQNEHHSKEIFRAWRVQNPNNKNPLSVQFKHAMVDYFKNYGKIFVSTDSGAEGLNLQFSNTIINYDLPWNPQRIEQRIGRVHRYGQNDDVVAINFLNTENEADKRVYDILSKKFMLFEGVFGASDEALGLLANDLNFEKTVLDIYQKCNSVSEYTKSFDKLNRTIDAKREKSNKSLKSILQVTTKEEKERELNNTKKELIKFFKELDYWKDYDESKIENLIFKKVKVDYNPFEFIGLNHGYLFIGGLVDKNRCIAPVLMLTDSKGGPISVSESELINIIEHIDNAAIKDWKTTNNEDALIKKTYDKVTGAAIFEHDKKVQKYKDYNSRKVDNWTENRKSLLDIDISEKQKTIDGMKEHSKTIVNFSEKIDYLKSVKAQETLLDKMRLSYFDRVSEIERNANEEKIKFDKLYEINPIFLAKIVMKF